MRGGLRYDAAVIREVLVLRVLLVRPADINERFGLGPFFRIEPLGLEYVAASLEAGGHEAIAYDARFAPSIEKLIARHRPGMVGIAAAHTLDTPSALEAARRVKACDPSIVTLMGGHAAAVYPTPFFDSAVDAVCFEDGEQVAPEAAAALDRGQPLEGIPGLHVRADRADPDCVTFVRGPSSGTRITLDRVPLPARHALASGHRHYLCVQRRPVHLVETSRGCPYRCSFCTIWQHVDRSFRFRSNDHVAGDLASVGGNVFLADDLFWYPGERSLDLARELRHRGIRKDWILAQTRTDLVARHPALLEAWRPVARAFDIFFGFEAPTDAGLESLTKDADVEAIEAAVGVCRRLGFGVTGNFIVDPDWERGDFEALWEFTDRLRLDHVGFTILTPLPGTEYFERMRPRILETDWSRYDMHHILWEPRLGRKRFFELFAETWRRSALHVRNPGALLSYLKQVRPARVPFLLKVLSRSRRLFNPEAYLREAFPEGTREREAAGAAGAEPV